MERPHHFVQRSTHLLSITEESFKYNTKNIIIYVQKTFLTKWVKTLKKWYLKISIQLDNQNLFIEIEKMVWTLSQTIFENYHSLDSWNMCIEI
jgi:hypothetical protein